MSFDIAQLVIEKKMLSVAQRGSVWLGGPGTDYLKLSHTLPRCGTD